MQATLSPPETEHEAPTRSRLPPKLIGDALHYRLSVDQFEAMLRLGLLGENDAAEYVDGILYRKMPTNPPHDSTANETAGVVMRVCTPGWCARVQSTLALSDGRPEPDVLIARGRQFDYSGCHPIVDDVALVVEVADTSLEFDRTTKLETYAKAQVAAYWIINLIDRQIEVHTQPDAAGPEPRYASRVVYAADATIALPAALGGASIAVAELLPPA